MIADVITRSVVSSSFLVGVASVLPQSGGPAAGTPEGELIAWAVRALLAASLALNGYFLARVAKLVGENEKKMVEMEKLFAAHQAEWNVWRGILHEDYSGERRFGPADRRHHDPPGDIARLEDRRGHK